MDALNRTLKGRTSRKVTIPASRGGWVQNASLLEPVPYSAEVLDNFFPTSEGIRLRGGSTKHATLGAAVKQIMPFHSGSANALFAASATDVYDITTPADPEVAPTADISSLTNGDWSYINFGAGGGSYLWMVNGADDARHYNGTVWASPSITGVTSSDLSACWAFGERIFAIEGGTMSAWYLPVDAVAGAMSELPLGPLFNLGGSLLFGATWSLDSGAGLDDVCVFVTDQGEIAVYEGSDPASASTWNRIGVYRIAKPLSKFAWFKAGGDVAVGTEDGIISLSAAAQADRAAITRSAITYPIEDAWRDAITLRSAAHPFHMTMWQKERMLLVSVPDTSAGEFQSYASNARTGAWARFTGWDVQCLGVLDETLYFGAADFSVYTAETTGQDDGAPYSAWWLPKYTSQPGFCELTSARIVYRGNVNLDPMLYGATGYDVTRPAAPTSAVDEQTSTWGTGLWGAFVWGAGVGYKAVASEWQGVAGIDDEVSAWVVSTSGRTTKPRADVVSLELLVTDGTFR